MARVVADHACERERAIQVAGERVQHAHLSRWTQRKHGSQVSGSAALSRAVEISRRVRDESAVRNRSFRSGELVQDGVRAVARNLEQESMFARATGRGGAKQITRRVAQQPRLRSCAVRSTLEGVEHRQLSIPAELENRSASGSRRLGTRDSAGLRHADQASIGTLKEWTERLASVRAAAEGVEHMQRTGGIQPEHAPAAKLAVTGPAGQRGSKDVAILVPADEIGRA